MSAHNVKLHPKKTKVFPVTTTVFGFIKEGQNLKPNPHSLLAIHKSPKPTTTTQLRGYLGQFKTFFKHIPHCARILETLEKFVAKFPGKNQPLIWEPEASSKFEKSQKEILNAAAISFSFSGGVDTSLKLVMQRIVGIISWKKLQTWPWKSKPPGHWHCRLH